MEILNLGFCLRLCTAEILNLGFCLRLFHRGAKNKDSDSLHTYNLFFNSDPAARGTGLYIAAININWGNRLLQVVHVNWSIDLFS